MLSFLPAPLRGGLAALLLALNTLFWCWPLFALSLLAGASRSSGTTQPALRHALDRRVLDRDEQLLDGSGSPDPLGRAGPDQVDMHHSCTVTSNHQSWADILVLQYQLNRRMPFLKFFLKQELIWVPVIGLCWWALEFPFMKRFSKEYGQAPGKARRGPATTRRACRRYRTNPVSVFNFLEGTRFTEDKHAEQARPIDICSPRAGGIAFVIDAMGEQLSALINITIHYPDGRPSFWDLLPAISLGSWYGSRRSRSLPSSCAGTTIRTSPTAWPSSSGSTSCGPRRTHNWPSCIRTTRRGADRSERAPGHAGRKRPGLLGCHRR